MSMSCDCVSFVFEMYCPMVCSLQGDRAASARACVSVNEVTRGTTGECVGAGRGVGGRVAWRVR